MRFLRFLPIYQQRVWGGRALNTELGRTLPDSTNPYGESWEIVDRPEAQSVIAEGPHTGRSLADLRSDKTTWLMGPTWNPTHPFPILVKWLDCRERLSLQVHPPAEIATKLGGEPKTENWYVHRAQSGASLIAGLQADITAEKLEQAIEQGTLEECVHRFPVVQGDSLFVPSGRLHAIDAGNLILEIQQNSDTTYRVYDWGRVGLDGQPRQLHLTESLASIRFDDTEPFPLAAERHDQLLADAPEFKLERKTLTAGQSLEFAAADEPRLLSIVEGQLEEQADGHPLQNNETVLLPYGEPFSFTPITQSSTVLITSGFSDL